jgi:hypothetical protein
MDINLTKFWRVIFGLFSCVVAGHVVGVYLNFGQGIGTQYPDSVLLNLFFFGSEKNITALFSSYLFIVVGLCFHCLAKQNLEHKSGWQWLRNIAIYLACDEWFAIHDTTLNGFGLGPFDVPYWVWVYAGVCCLLLFKLLPFIRYIPSYLIKYLGVGAAVFIGGAAIMEVVTYQNQEFNSLFFQVGLFFEDGLEISGLMITVYGLFSYFKRQKVTVLIFPKLFCVSVLVIGTLDFLVSYYLYK